MTEEVKNREEIHKMWGKKSEDVRNDIQTLTEWMKRQKHLPEVMEPNMIEHVLINCKFSLERTKKCLDMYYTARKLVPEIYEKINPKFPEMNEAKKMVCYYHLPKLTENFCKIHVFKLKDYDVEKFNCYSVLAFTLNILEIAFHEDLEMGVEVIIDGEHMKFGHLLRMTPVHMKKISFINENVIKTRIKSIHLINCSSFIDKLMYLAKFAMKKKIMDRVIVHQSYESLYKYISQDLLPADYGGKNKSAAEIEEYWDEKLKQYQDRFDKLDQFEINEDLRPEPLSNSEELGYHGSFKKLQVD